MLKYRIFAERLLIEADDESSWLITRIEVEGLNGDAKLVLADAVLDVVSRRPSKKVDFSDFQKQNFVNRQLNVSQSCVSSD